MATDLIAEREYLEIIARRYSDGAEAGRRFAQSFFWVVDSAHTLAVPLSSGISKSLGA